ncbi:MAG: hypothetical protein WCQ47_00085 [bacterium]
MLFLINKRNFLLTLSVFFCLNLKAVTNPFSVNFESQKKELDGHMTQFIKVSISSRSIEEAKYQMFIDVPSNGLSVIDGKKVYSGVLAPLKSEDIYISVNLSSTAEGEIKAKVYNYIDDRELDTQNLRVFGSKYSITKNVDALTGSYLLNIGSTNEKADTEKTSDVKNSNNIDNKIVIDDQSKQKFVVDPKNRYNNTFRGLLFILSFFIIGWLTYRIINKKL